MGSNTMLTTNLPWITMILPEQLNPSPLYPVSQVQLKVPGMFVQVANWLHPPLFSAHSFTSVYIISYTGGQKACHSHPTITFKLTDVDRFSKFVLCFCYLSNGSRELLAKVHVLKDTLNSRDNPT